MTDRPNKKKQAKLQDLFQQGLNAHQNKQWHLAEQFYKQVISKDHSFISAYINLGAVYRQNQQVEQAKECYKQAISHDTKSLEAWFNLGNLLLAERDWQEANLAFNEVLKFNHQHQGALSQLATIARLQGEWQLAISLLQRWINAQPDVFEAHLALGNAYRHLGQNDSALKHYKLAVHFSENSWKAHYSLARLADQLGDSATFSQHYQIALNLSDQPRTIHCALAQTRFDNGNLVGAEEQYQFALSLEADDFEARLGLGAVLMSLGKINKAKDLFQQLSQLNDVHLLSLLAKEIWTHKFFSESIAVLEKMLNLRPDLYDTHLNLAKAYSQTWQFSKAIPCIDQTLKLKADCDEAKHLLADIYLRQGQCDQSIDIYEQKLVKDGFNASDAACLLFTLLYSRKYSVEYKAQRHKDLMQKILPDTSRTTIFSNSKKVGRQLKIAYISADFRDQHPVGLFITPVLEHHDHDQFHVAGYYNNRTYDESTQDIQALTDHWLEVSSWTDARLQQQIVSDGIDILIDLSGQTSKNRLGVFALGAAPVQVSWLGYPHSSGLSAIDYLIADPICCPPENDQLCTEQVYRLPDHCVFCYPVKEDYPNYQRPEKPLEKIVFGSFNNLTKVNTYTLQLWVKLLHEIPKAHLYLKTPSFTDPKCIEQFYTDFKNLGISRDRLTLSAPCGLDEMMHEYLRIDIGLDPVPYNGGTTSLQALWMGVPILTLSGDNFCGRMGASIMKHAGLSDWVAESEEEYIAIAQEKAAQANKLYELKEGLREKLRRSPLFDNAGFTQALEKAYLEFWTNYCQR